MHHRLQTGGNYKQERRAFDSWWRFLLSLMMKHCRWNIFTLWRIKRSSFVVLRGFCLFIQRPVEGYGSESNPRQPQEHHRRFKLLTRSETKWNIAAGGNQGVKHKKERRVTQALLGTSDQLQQREIWDWKITNTITFKMLITFDQ